MLDIFKNQKASFYIVLRNFEKKRMNVTFIQKLRLLFTMYRVCNFEQKKIAKIVQLMELCI